MKPSIFHRFLLVVLTLLGMVVGLLLLVMATGLYPLDTLRIDRCLSNPAGDA